MQGLKSINHEGWLKLIIRMNWFTNAFRSCLSLQKAIIFWKQLNYSHTNEDVEAVATARLLLARYSPAMVCSAETVQERCEMTFLGFLCWFVFTVMKCCGLRGPCSCSSVCAMQLHTSQEKPVQTGQIWNNNTRGACFRRVSGANTTGAREGLYH